MPSFSQMFRSSVLRHGLFGVAAGTSVVGITNIGQRYNDTVQGEDAFSQHTRTEHRNNLISGMHAPLMPTPEQHANFMRDFPQYKHLLPTSLDAFRRQQAIKTPVRMRPLSECPQILDYENAGTLVVGGAPALVSATAWVKKNNDLTYINDERRWPIAYGSAWHLEEDAESEAPTSYKPSNFMANQIWRATVGYVPLASIEKTGFFPWRTLDWIGWIHHPELWIPGIQLAFNFQLATMANPQKRQALVQEVAQQCKRNEGFYAALNQEVGGQLLLPGTGSIIVARNEAEVADLLAMKEGLSKECRELKILSKAEMKQRYGFVPEGEMFGEKTHDRVLSPNFMPILTTYIKKQGGKVINGTLITVYTDGKTPGGIAEYQTTDGQKVLIPFSKLIMSLGSQPILDENDKPCFNVVAARGVSVLARVSVPQGYRLPPAIVCGGTNHATKLSTNPVSFQDENGQSYDQYLFRITAAACITPNVSAKEAVDYDGSAAVGLIASVRKTLSGCLVDPIIVYGCNRQVSEYGETQWKELAPGIKAQFGAGGGGLTRAPDVVAENDEQATLVSSMTNRR